MKLLKTNNVLSIYGSKIIAGGFIILNFGVNKIINFNKLILITFFSLLISVSFVHASSGIFKVSHDLGFGKDTNLDPITKGRLFQVIEKTMNRLVRNDLNGVPSP